MASALTIAGSDSGGGAGIQADLKTFAAHGVFGTSAITALTAQNTRGVTDIHPVPHAFVRAQIDAVVEDIGCDAVKTGMLGSSHIVEVVAAAITDLSLDNVVVDPVMVAKGGDRLLAAEAVDAVKSLLLRVATVVTPNLPEAEVLAGLAIESVDDMRRAAAVIARLGARAVIVRGGHLAGPSVVDVLLDGGREVVMTSERVEGRHTHGTGCTFAAAIAANLALGTPLEQAARLAKIYVAGAMRTGIDVGSGHQPLDHFWSRNVTRK